MTALATPWWLPPAQADRVTSAEQIHLGVQDHAMPFSYRVVDGYAGYTVDLCLLVVAALEARRGKPYANPPAARWVRVTSQTRLMRLLAGEIDLECSSTSITPARQSLGLTFSMPTFVSEVGVLLRVGKAGVPASAEQWLAEISARSAVVVTTEGSTSVQRLARLNRQAVGKPFPVVYGRDHEDSLRRLRQGDAEAFVMDRALLAAALARDERLRAAGLTLAPWSPAPSEIETYAIVLRDTDDELKEIVQQTLCELLRPGDATRTDLRRLYEHWFQPPRQGGKPPPQATVEAPGSAVLALSPLMHPELQRRLATAWGSDCSRSAAAAVPSARRP